MRKKAFITAVKYLFLSIVVFFLLMPLILTFCNSFVSPEDMTANLGKITLIPARVSLMQYYQAFFRRPRLLIMFWNSVIITLPIILGQVIVSTLAAYGFAKLIFPFRDNIFILFVILLMLPPQASMVSNYLSLDFFRLINTYMSVILPGMFSAFGICLLRQYMRYIPYETCEAAKIDGANAMQTFLYIVTPQAKGGIASLVVLAFIDNWNMIEQPLVFLKDNSKYPMSVYLAFTGDNGIAMAFGVFFMILPISVFLYFEKDFVKGIRL